MGFLRKATIGKKEFTLLLLGLFVLAVIPLTVSLTRQSEENTKPTKAAATRDPLKQPFASNSIWNLPIGANAQRQKANLVYAAEGIFRDENIIIHSLNSPQTNLYEFSGEPWDSGTNRCVSNGTVLTQLPLPSSLIVPGNNGSNGTTPNHSAAVLYRGSDGRLYYHQSQPITHCTTSSAWTTRYEFSEDNGESGGKDAALDGPGRGGAQGGSSLSSVGGAIRVGELVPGGSINHAVKVILDGANFSRINNGYRWPAFRADSCWSSCYGAQANPEVRMGSLLALPPDFDINSLETEPARILARAARNYGFYIVDGVGPVWSFAVEQGTGGDVKQEFQSRWGYAFGPWGRRGIAWERDVDEIMTNLDVITNWNQSLYNTVATSNGSQGAGGGTPLVGWAAEVCPTSPCSSGGDTTNPTANLTSPANGATVSGTNVALNATASDNVSVSQVQFFVNNSLVGSDSTSPYSFNWNSATVTNGSYSVFARAIDSSSNQGNSNTITINVNNTTADTTPPVVSNGSPMGTLTAGTTITTLSVSTNEVATCKYGTVAGVAYTSITSTFTSTGGTTHSTNITGLTNGSSRTYYVRCQDASNNTNSSDYIISFSVANPSTPLPIPWVTTDIGTASVIGSATYSSGTFTVSGAGSDIWDISDSFRYVYQDLVGNGMITAKVNSQTNTDPWAKAGVMIRETTAANSKHAMMIVSPSNGTGFQSRISTGGTTTHIGTSGTAPIWLRLQRSGSTITGYQSSDGTNFSQVGSVTVSMTSSVKIGLIVTSHNTTTTSQAIFTSVNVSALTIKLGDINNDGSVNSGDLAVLVSKWGTNDANADLSGNGVVDSGDLAILISRWGSTIVTKK